MLPNGQAGKNFISETTRLINAWAENSPLKEIAWKAVFIMPALLLQKPAKESKSKDHVKALQRRLELWHKGEFEQLLDESQTLQERLPKTSTKSDISAISKRFANHMKKGEINKAINVITNNMVNGILPLTDETIALLVEKHPKPKEACSEIMLHGPVKPINAIVFDAIDDEMVLRAAKSTEGGSGPSGMDATGWKKSFVPEHMVMLEKI